MKRGILCLIITVFTAGGLFAQTEEESAPEKEKFPRSTITLDAWPSIQGAVVGGVLNSMVGGGSGFGVAAQYEFQIIQMVSVAGRFEYLGAGMSVSGVSMDLSAYSIEGHARLYPFKGAFFLDALLGYAHYEAKLSGGGENMESLSDYFKLGGKLGWRIDFGKPGGFVFEPSFGYAVGIGDKSKFGDIKTGYKKLDDQISGTIGSLNEMNDLLANYLFVGGPKMSLALGWRF
jgi:hypothetical protein